MDNRLEERYIVIKISHLNERQISALDDCLWDFEIDTVDCVVVEEDWSIYPAVVDMVLKEGCYED